MSPQLVVWLQETGDIKMLVIEGMGRMATLTGHSALSISFMGPVGHTEGSFPGCQQPGMLP